MGQKLQLRNYQKEAVSFLLKNDSALILAPVGAGKTAVAITAMKDKLESKLCKRWLVITTKRVAIHVWPEELSKWAPKLRVSIAVGTPKIRLREFNAKTDIVVATFDNVATFDDLYSFDGIIIDELTKLKNTSTKRFKILDKLIKNIKIRWGLTGSFTSNGLEDVFGQCKIINEEILGKHKTTFLNSYFYLMNRDFGLYAPRPGAYVSVMNKIRPYTYILESDEYSKELPNLNILNIFCDLENRKLYNDMKQKYTIFLSGANISAINAGVVSAKLQQMASGFIYDKNTTHWISKHKFVALEDLIDENQQENVIIIYNYQEELAELKRIYPKATTITDKNAVDLWNGGKIPILLLHPKSAAHGLNLQKGGNKIIFLSLPWSLELYEQVIGRLHRSGQKNPVWVYLILAKNTIDEKILLAIKNKSKFSEIVSEELFNGYN